MLPGWFTALCVAACIGAVGVFLFLALRPERKPDDFLEDPEDWGRG